jgi:Ni/Co efflux regulator RcnB
MRKLFVIAVTISVALSSVQARGGKDRTGTMNQHRHQYKRQYRLQSGNGDRNTLQTDARKSMKKKRNQYKKGDAGH